MSAYPMTTTEELDRFGYAVIPGVISPQLRGSLRDAAEQLLASNITRGRDRGLDGKDGFRGCLALNPSAFLPLLAPPRVLPVIVDALGPNIRILSSQIIVLPSISPDQPRNIRTPQRPGWHRDLYGVTADLGHEHTPRLAIKCGYYVTDISPDAGLTMFLPGSHLRTVPPEIPAGEIDPPGAQTVELNKDGTDAVLFENRTWHAGGLNTSERPRIAIMIQYGYRWLATVDDPAPELLDHPGLTDIERQLLGTPDRNPDGSVAEGRGSEPLYRWAEQQRAD
ncbi:MAG: phytanoyl-CoA dioxygenase family protein [Haloechinothrix sp.]